MTRECVWAARARDKNKTHDMHQSHDEPSYMRKADMLRDCESTWMKALAEIFCFYNKLQKQTKGEYSFENFKEKMNHMSLGEWVKFCTDFGLSVPKPTVLGLGNLAESKNEHNRKVLTQLFKREAKGSLGINLTSFQVCCIYLVHPSTIEPKNQDWT